MTATALVRFGFLLISSAYLAAPAHGQQGDDGPPWTAERSRQTFERFLYVNNNVAGGELGSSVSGFRVNATSGAPTLVPGSPFRTGGDGSIPGPVDGLACCGRFLYAINGGASGIASVSGFTVDPSTGALAAVPGSPFATTTTASIPITGLACAADNAILYVANNTRDPIVEDIRIYRIDPLSGTLSPSENDPFDLPPGSAFPIDLEITGSYLLVSQVLTQEMSGSVGVYRIGASASLSPVDGSPFPLAEGLAGDGTLTPDGAFYYVASAGRQTNINGFAVGSDGRLTPVAGSPFPYRATALATDETGTLLFASNADVTDSIHVLRIDPDSGALSMVAGSPFAHDTSENPGGLVAGNHLLFVANGIYDVFASTLSVFSVDPGTGALTSVPGSPFQRGETQSASAASAVAFCPSEMGPLPTQTPTGTAAQATPTPTSPAIACIGDCDGGGTVTVDELVKGVNIALGTLSLTDCPSFDKNGDDTVTVDELITAVNDALNGC